MPPTAPNDRQPSGGSSTNLKKGPGEKTVTESSATPVARSTTESAGAKVNSKARPGRA